MRNCLQDADYVKGAATLAGNGALQITAAAVSH